MSKDHLRDPRKMYRTEDFPEQKHEHPQTQEAMTPEPDCGETSYKGNKQLEGRNALITGADSGIGRAVAIAYAREGANLVIQYLQGEEEDVAELEEILAKEDVTVKLLQADFRNEGEAQQLVLDAKEALGALDILVLNAGQQFAVGELQNLAMQQVKDTFSIKVFSIYEIVKAAEEFLKPGSAIITTTSVQAFDPSPYFLDYAATNGAINNLTISLAKYFTPKGIRVNGVAPGPIWTPLQLDGGQPDREAIKNFGQFSLLERAGQPVELAPVYVFLASDKASYVSSQIYGVTGGQPTN